jgi:hypothetical protein
MYKKKTLRNMKPVTRRYARNLNSLQGILKRLQNLTEDIGRLELDSRALFQSQHPQRIEGDPPANLDDFMSDYFKQQEDDDEL